MALPQNSCDVLELLDFGQFQQIQKILGKMAALRRLAELLDQVGTTIPLPNVSQMLPMSMIDLGLYNQLRTACPQLGLPAPNVQHVQDLQARVLDSYNQMLAMLTNHPWKRMGRFQALVDDAISKVNDQLSALDLDFFSCLEAACQFATAVPSVNHGTSAKAKQIYDSTVRLGGSYAEVLDAQKQAKLQQVNDIVDQINVLKSS